MTALSLSVMLMLNMTATALPVSAAAGESKTYTHDGYTVEYTVMGEWAGNQNIQVTITNTSDEVLSNWAVGYNARGEINGLWNAQVYGHQGTEYILSGASYNCEIEPGQSTNFGYILTGDNFKIPQNIYNCAERVDITDGYNVYYNITGDYGDTYQAEMVVENLSDTDINAWQLSFDGNATIDNLWNGKLIENENGSFKVKNAEHNVVIGAGNSTSFNFSGKKLAEETGFDAVETSAFVTEPVIETTVVTDVSEEAFTDVSETDIVISENETEAVSESETVTETEISVETEISAETEIVTETEAITETTTVFEQEIETNAEVVFDNFKLTGIVIPMEFDFEIDPEMDSDEDGLPDYIEKEIGSDRYNPDTDSDKLPDGYEYFMLETDPIKEDTDDNTISDADEDFDEDNLSNLEEYNLGTDPFSKDSDYDNLSDYDEVNIHNTDPTEPDSDTDKVSDGDEIELGLDPNNPATNGYPDNEYTTEQTVGEDSEALDYINNIEDNPYTVSVEITAAGVAENNLSAGESGYSYSILQNDAVLGVVPELSYSAGLSVTDVVINFNIDASQTDTSIENLMVFKYFEDTNMLLPIETTYNEITNTVSTHVDEVGTYCLIDVEKWLGILEETPAGNYYEGGENEPANIVFCLDTRSVIDEESFNAVKADIKAITENAFDRYSDIKVYVYYQQFGSDFKATNKLLTDSNGNNYFTGYEEAVAALDKLETYMIKNNYWAYDFVEATQFMIDNCDEKIIAMYHITADDRVMGGINKAKKLTQTVQNSKYTTAEGEEIQRIYVSTLCPNDAEPFDTSSYAYELATLSGGIAVTGYVANEDTEVMTAEVDDVEVYANDDEETEVVNDDINESLVAILGEGNNNLYKTIMSTGLVYLKLDTQLRPDNYYESQNLNPTDTDEDGLSDWCEVDIKYINKFLGGQSKETIKTGDLPTIGMYVSDYSDVEYVQKGYEEFILRSAYTKYYGDKQAAKADIDKYRILPIISDPTEVDSDSDGYLDAILNEEIVGKEYNIDGYIDIADPEPLYSNIQKYQLNENYIPVQIHEELSSYGGNQEWFYDEVKYPEYYDDIGKFIKYNGCGLIAFSDIILYISNYNDKYSNLTDLKINAFDSKNIPCSVYQDYVRANYQLYDEISLIENWTLPYKFKKLFNKLFDYKAVNLKASFSGIRSSDIDSLTITQANMLKIIPTSLNKGLPVQLCINKLTKPTVYKPRSLYYYLPSKSISKPYQALDTLKVDKNINSHAVVITGLIKDDVQKKCFVEISSWGDKYIIVLDDLIYSSNAIGTGLIYIS